MSMLDPVIDNTLTDTKMFGDLRDGHFFRLTQQRRRDLICIADCTDDGGRKCLACGAKRGFPAKLLRDFGICEVTRQLTHTIDHCGRVADAIRYARRTLDGDVCARSSLPADVD
jgi:hypothetical protein